MISDWLILRWNFLSQKQDIKFPSLPHCFHTNCYCLQPGIFYLSKFSNIGNNSIYSISNISIIFLHTTYVCSGSVVVTAHDSESGRPGSIPEWGLIYYEASITAQGSRKPSSLRGSTLGTRAAEHEGCNWGMQVDWWLQPCAVFDHSFSGISWHMPQK